jgi:hypothetical protein
VLPLDGPDSTGPSDYVSARDILGKLSPINRDRIIIQCFNTRLQRLVKLILHVGFRSVIGRFRNRGFKRGESEYAQQLIFLLHAEVAVLQNESAAALLVANA